MNKTELRSLLSKRFQVTLTPSEFKAMNIAQLEALVSKKELEAQIINVESTATEEQVELKVEDGIPTPENQVKLEVIQEEEIKEEVKMEVKKEVIKEEVKVAKVFYFQHKVTRALYRWVKNEVLGSSNVVVFVGMDKKELKVGQVTAKKFFTPVTVDFVKKYLAAKSKAEQSSQARANKTAKSELQVNVRLENGQRAWSVTDTGSNKTFKAVEGKSVTNVFRSYEVQIGKLTAQVQFKPVVKEEAKPVEKEIFIANENEEEVHVPF